MIRPARGVELVDVGSDKRRIIIENVKHVSEWSFHSFPPFLCSKWSSSSSSCVLCHIIKMQLFSDTLSFSVSYLWIHKFPLSLSFPLWIIRKCKIHINQLYCNSLLFYSLRKTLWGWSCKSPARKRARWWWIRCLAYWLQNCGHVIAHKYVLLICLLFLLYKYNIQLTWVTLP